MGAQDALRLCLAHALDHALSEAAPTMHVQECSPTVRCMHTSCGSSHMLCLAQVLKIVYLGGTSKGGFFPNGEPCMP